MLAQAEKPTGDFLALARYLVEGKERPTSPARVAWVMARNMPTEDPEVAAKMMAATAEHSRRCRHACYHLMIAWHPDENPSPEVMQDIAVATLALAGLAEHQVLVMGHGDKPHRHLHMMVNRVHPETGKAWSTRHDYQRFDAIMRQLSEAHGFSFVPAHRFNPDLTDDTPKKPASRARYAARRGASTHREQWSARRTRAVAAEVSEGLDAASTWEDVEAAFAEAGYQVQRKGKGYVVGNASGYAKLSRLGLTRTAKGFMKRRTKMRSMRVLFGVDAVDIARALGSRQDVRAAVQEAAARRQARLAKQPLIVQLLAGLDATLRATTALTPSRRKRIGRRPVKTKSRVRSLPTR